MRSTPSAFAYAGALTAAALLGGAVALAGAAAFGDLGSHSTTVREIVAGQSNTPASFATAQHRLTIHDIFQRSAPGVVQVTSTSVVQSQPDFFDPFGGTETQKALGSGFVIDKAGHIVTNEHVVEGAKSVEVSFSNNESVKARIVGVDRSTDVAVLQVDARSRALTPLVLGNSDSVKVGDSVVAIGNPLGYDRSVTSGIVSAVGRSIEAPNAFSIDHAIQTDAALNHGNSGGPLLDAQGQVVGVNSQIAASSSDSGNIGIGFAIPINTVKTVVAQLIRNGKAEHAFLGIEAKELTPQIAHLFHLPVEQGLLVTAVCRGGGADQAGLKAGTQQVIVSGESWPLGGDILVAADGARLVTLDRMRSLIAAHKPGDALSLTVYRNSKKQHLTVKLGRQPTSPQC